MFDRWLSGIILFACIAVSIVILYFSVKTAVEIFKKERRFKGNGIKGAVALLASLFVVALCEYCLYEIPNILYYGYNWAMIWEFGPDALVKAVKVLYVLVPLICVYFLLSYYFTKPKEKPYLLIVIMSTLSGFGNSLMVFITNEALGRTISDSSHMASIQTRLYIYFILGLLLFTTADYFTRRKMIVLTNSLIYEKRMKIIDKIFSAPYYKFEMMENGKTFAALNNDPEIVSSFVNMFVQILTGGISLIVCFIYLWTLNGWGTFLSIVMIVFAAGLFMLVSRSAAKVFEKNRDIQNLFFKNINDMVSGFKELYINKTKRDEFHADIADSCKKYRNTRIEGDSKYVGVTILGNTLYMVVIGIVVFTFSMIFSYITNSTLRSFVVVYLYMGGIITMLTGQIPNLVRVMVSWKRIDTFIGEISTLQEESSAPIAETDDLTIKLCDIGFSYKNDSGECFTLGPINCEFHSGEVVFISGGNGSGKTTLAKLITGLYKPDEGAILINGQKSASKTLGGYFTTVYSDFHLFDRLYGIDSDASKDKIDRYLEVLKIKNKVKIEDGKFSTIALSTGQRKRLALLISYLEDKPAFFFDEWAADQDPEFRKYFYTELLPELKSKGKLIIAITHDDRYFDEADKLIKMEMGRIVEQRSSVSVNGKALEPV